MACFNYDIQPGDWKPLTDIMADDYEVHFAYTIRVNSGQSCLRLLETLGTPDNTQRGKEYPPYREISIPKDRGDEFYLTASIYPINICVEEVATE